MRERDAGKVHHLKLFKFRRGIFQLWVIRRLNRVWNFISDGLFGWVVAPRVSNRSSRFTWNSLKISPSISFFFYSVFPIQPTSFPFLSWLPPACGPTPWGSGLVCSGLGAAVSAYSQSGHYLLLSIDVRVILQWLHMTGCQKLDRVERKAGSSQSFSPFQTCKQEDIQPQTAFILIIRLLEIKKKTISNGQFFFRLAGRHQSLHISYIFSAGNET